MQLHPRRSTQRGRPGIVPAVRSGSTSPRHREARCHYLQGTTCSHCSHTAWQTTRRQSSSSLHHTVEAPLANECCRLPGNTFLVDMDGRPRPRCLGCACPSRMLQPELRLCRQGTHGPSGTFHGPPCRHHASHHRRLGWGPHLGLRLHRTQSRLGRCLRVRWRPVSRNTGPLGSQCTLQRCGGLRWRHMYRLGKARGMPSQVDSNGLEGKECPAQGLSPRNTRRLGMVRRCCSVPWGHRCRRGRASPTSLLLGTCGQPGMDSRSRTVCYSGSPPGKRSQRHMDHDIVRSQPDQGCH